VHPYRLGSMPQMGDVGMEPMGPQAKGFARCRRGHPALYSGEMTFAFQEVHYVRGGVSLSPNTLTSHPRADVSVIL